MSLSTLRILSKFSDDHDAFLCPLFYGSLLAGCVVAGSSSEGPSNFRAAGLFSLAKTINDARFTLRFWLGVKSLVGLLSPAAEDPKSLYASSTLLPSLRKAQQALGVLYNVLEVPAYLKNTAAPQLFSYDGKWFGRQSALVALGILLIEVYCCYHQMSILERRELDDEDKRKQIQREKFVLLFKLIICVCEIPLAHNWSQVSEYLNPFHIGFLGSLSSSVKLFLWWKKQQAELKKEQEKQK